MVVIVSSLLVVKAPNSVPISFIFSGHYQNSFLAIITTRGNLCSCILQQIVPVWLISGNWILTSNYHIGQIHKCPWFYADQPFTVEGDRSQLNFSSYTTVALTAHTLAFICSNLRFRSQLKFNKAKLVHFNSVNLGTGVRVERIQDVCPKWQFREGNTNFLVSHSAATKYILRDHDCPEQDVSPRHICSSSDAIIISGVFSGLNFTPAIIATSRTCGNFVLSWSCFVLTIIFCTMLSGHYGIDVISISFILAFDRMK